LKLFILTIALLPHPNPPPDSHLDAFAFAPASHGPGHSATRCSSAPQTDGQPNAKRQAEQQGAVVFDKLKQCGKPAHLGAIRIPVHHERMICRPGRIGGNRDIPL
jgi:hypothetical protein